MPKNILAARDPTSIDQGKETAARGALSDRIAVGPFGIDPIPLEELTRKLIVHAFQPGRTNHVITANAQFYVLAARNETFRRCLSQAEYVCADGVSVLLACKWLRRSSPMRVPGVELVPALCQEAAEHDLPVYFLGGKPGSAAKTASILLEQYPSFRVAGVACPPIGFIRNPEVLSSVVEDIRAAKPAIIFVAFGAPFQEYFIQEFIRPLGIPVAVGVGGSFEMIAGFVARAPLWMRRAGFEWLFRWSKEPMRLASRYMVGNTLFFYYLGQSFLRERLTVRR